MDRPVFSDMLAERRRELGYSIRQASRILRLREDVLVAFEEGDFEQMPKSGYAQGMLSSYARYLGLEARVVVDAYNKDLNAYKRGMSRGSGRKNGGFNRNGSHGSGQTYVATRGLLPTSGGLAGDMGSFATTRVRTRQDTYAEADDPVIDADQNRYPQGRPYTRRVPKGSMRTYGQGSSRSAHDIEMLGVDGYDDDLRLGRDASPYEAASSRSGRRSSRNISNSKRPRVERRNQPSRSRGKSRNGANGSRNGRRSGSSNSGGMPINTGLIVVIVVAIVLSAILIFSIGSCIRQDTSEVHTVPVTAASSSGSAASGSAGNTAQNGQSSASGSTKSESKEGSSSSSSSASSSSSSSLATSSKETSVSVSVADGGVTWLEVACDGKSDVAETVTGPWQKTYTVKDSITIQAGDTTAVSVVQDGRQVQFESMTSGIGSIRIHSNKSTSTTTKESGTDSSSASTGTKSVNSETSTSTSETSGDGTTSAKTGNASSTGKQKVDSENTGTETGSGDNASYYEDYGYGYDDSYGYY